VVGCAVLLATPQKVFRGSSKGIRDLRATGAVLGLPHNLTLKAEALEESEIEASFCEAIRIARQQKSVSLEKRAEGTFAEYGWQKASASGGLGFRVPLG